jgi:hypothetical protein
MTNQDRITELEIENAALRVKNEALRRENGALVRQNELNEGLLKAAQGNVYGGRK